MFHSVSRQHCKVWASQLLFLHSLRDVIPPSEACLYGHINWCLAQAQQHSSMGLSQSFPSKRGGKARPWTAFHFTVQKRPVPGSSGASMAKRPHLESGNELVRVARSLLVVVSSPVLLILGGKGAMGVSTPDVSKSSAPSSATSAVFRLVCFSNF